MKGHIARICTSFIDIPDKIAIAIYFAGCSIRCKNCQNKELWDKSSGQEYSIQDVLKKIKEHPLADSVVFLGGEPTDQTDFLTELCEKIKNEDKKNLALYSGREFEVLSKKLLENLDLIICGPYKEELHVQGWPASSNQRVFRKENGQWHC
ncbi:radical SAM protein [Candidatus Babeliales bacterium]|nr:radical SAM protein [Candidatus Babeliales bacterium]MCF7899394.1 radical SAM protein [Candidatus Babeliales bacterium]